MPTEILSGLWIGSLNDVYNSEFYNDNNINIAINCTCDQGFLNRDDIKKIRIPLSNTNNSVYELTGKIDVEDVLDVLFDEFCIGK